MDFVIIDSTALPDLLQFAQFKNEENTHVGELLLNYVFFNRANGTEARKTSHI